MGRLGLPYNCWRPAESVTQWSKRSLLLWHFRGLVVIVSQPTCARRYRWCSASVLGQQSVANGGLLDQGGV